MFTDFRFSAWTISALVLILLVASHAGLRWWVARRSTSVLAKQPTSAARRLHRNVTAALREMVAPVMLVAWAQGLSFVLTMTLAARPGEAAQWLTQFQQWCAGAVTIAACVWAFVRIGRLLEIALTTMATRSSSPWDDILLPTAGRALRRLLPLVAIMLGSPAITMAPRLAEAVRYATSVALIVATASVLIQAVNLATALVRRRYRIDVSDNLRARSIHTQVVMVRRIAHTVIAVFAAACVLMVFDSVRQFGASILASAGIASVIIGLAAQRSIATLMAGVQVAMAQPIRVDDVVIVEGEFGRIEEITLTYVVVAVWDQRRIIVPMTYFIEKPFQNWTRISTDLLGTVFLYVDYRVPLADLRAELTRLLEMSPDWDHKVNALQVTDAREHVVELRALASAPDATRLWDLRCHIREGLIDFLQSRYPDSLPKWRAVVTATPPS